MNDTQTDVFQELLDEVKALREDLKATRRAVLSREEAAESPGVGDAEARFVLSHRVGSKCTNGPGPF